jgi:4-hydroxymandelate oxidase
VVERIETGVIVERDHVLPVNLLEYENLARELLPRASFDFIAGGSQDQVSLHGNRAAFGRWRILPRVMSGVESPSLATTVLGEHVSLPILISAMGLHCLAHPGGERATAAAAQRAGTVFTLSVASSTAMEEVAPLAGSWWFQLYLLVDRSLSVEHVRRAEAAGASAIVLTVDVTVRGRREADERNRFAMPAGITMPNLLPANFEGESPSYSTLTAWDKTISWRDLDWLAGQTPLPIVVKGILSPQDALLAAEHGAKAVIVSNHGGRQLDSAVASLDALPAVAAAVGDRVEVLLDGGIRRGTDVIKALALGARAVLAGRPILYGLAADGEEGVVRVFDLLRQELITDMILSGLSDITAIPRGLVVPDGPRLPASAV